MNRNVISRSLRISSLVGLVLALSVAFVPAFAETIVLDSGAGVALLSPDPNWNYLAGPPVTPLSASPFTAADFLAALTGPSAVVVPPYGGAWLPSLQCDPLAQWISVDAHSGPASTLFGRRFDVKTCCIVRATLTFCWAADDYLGDNAAGGPNPSGVYLNQAPLPIDGGNYATEFSVTVDVTSLVHCGANELHVYDRDGAAVVSGAMFSATLEITGCPLSTESATWSKIKALYR